MVNMSYCMAENTYNALREVYAVLEQTDFSKFASDEERKYAHNIINLCHEISDLYTEDKD